MNIIKKAIIVAGISAAAIGTHSILNSDLFKDRQELLKRHAQEIEMLTQENASLKHNISCLDDQVNRHSVDIIECESRADDAQSKLKESLCTESSYDFEQFLRSNPDARKYFPYILESVERYAEIWPVDPMFTLAIIWQESRFGKVIVSPAGALGDAQFIESTGQRYGLRTNEPYSWKIGRQNLWKARDKWKASSEIRGTLLSKLERMIGQDSTPDKIRDDVRNFISSNSADIEKYFYLIAEAEVFERNLNAAHAEYTNYIDLASKQVPQRIREIEQRQAYEERVARATKMQIKTKEQKEREKQILLDQYLSEVDERLSVIMTIDAAVHHHADLLKKYNGDFRIAAAGYNASPTALQNAGNNGTHGIPFIGETVNYVNQVYSAMVKFREQARGRYKKPDKNACYIGEPKQK